MVYLRTKYRQDVYKVNTLISLLLILLLSSVSLADVLFTGEGEELYGRVKSISGDSIWLNIKDGGDTLLLPGSITRIDFEKAGEEEITDSLLISLLEEKPEPENEGSYYLLYEKRNYEVNPDSSVNIYIRRVVQVFNEEGIWREGTPKLLYFKDNEQIKLLFARTIQPDGKIKSVASSAIERSSVYGWLPNYDRLGRLKFALGGLTEGSIIDWACEIKMGKIQSLEPLAKSINIAEKGEVREKIIRVSLPKGWKLNYDIANSKKIEVKSSTSKRGKVYIFHAKNIPSIHIENLQPPYIYIGSTLFFSTELSEENFLAKLKPIYEQQAEEVQEKLTNIVDTMQAEVGDNPFLVAQKLYDYMLNSFRIVSLSPTESRFYPVKLSPNLESGVLSLLDAHFCYWNMLKLAGISSSLLLVRNGDDGYLPKNQFNPNLYNSPLVRVELPDTSYYIYLASTDYPFGLIPSSFKGKPFLAILSKEKGLIPEQLAEEYFINQTIEGEFISPDTLALNITYSSYNQAIPTQRKQCRLPRQELKNSYIVSLSKKFRSFELDSFSLMGCKGDSIPTTKLFVKIFEPLIEGGESLWAFPLPGLPEPKNYAGASSRTNPIFLGLSTNSQLDLKIKLPKNLKPIGVPDPIEFDKAPFYYSFSVRGGQNPEENILQLNMTDMKTEGLYSKKDYKKLKEYLQSKANAKRKWVILKSSGDF